jgi:hypothetical protein
MHVSTLVNYLQQERFTRREFQNGKKATDSLVSACRARRVLLGRLMEAAAPNGAALAASASPLRRGCRFDPSIPGDGLGSVWASASVQVAVSRIPSQAFASAHVKVAAPRRWLVGASDRDLADILGGHESVVSEIVHGKRPLSKTHIERLSRRFNVSPAVFFPRVGAERE